MIILESSFEWDADKNIRNVAKHSISFYEAQSPSGLPTERGEYEFLEQVFGEKVKKYMSKKQIKYTNHPVNAAKRVKNLLPSPEDLIFKQKTTKVTIALSDQSLLFFKNKAKKHNTKYQKMIRELLDAYAEQYSLNE